MLEAQLHFMKTNTLSSLVTFEREFKSFINNLEEIKKRYKGKVVLVKDGKVLIAGSSFSEVAEKARKMGLDPANELIQFVPEEEVKLIL